MFPLILLRAAALNEHENKTGHHNCCGVAPAGNAALYAVMKWRPSSSLTLLASGFIELCIPSPKRAPTSADWIYELKIAATG